MKAAVMMFTTLLIFFDKVTLCSSEDGVPYYPLVEVVKHFPSTCEAKYKCPFRFKTLPTRVTTHFPASLAALYVAEASKDPSACRAVEKALIGGQALKQAEKLALKQRCYDAKVAALSRSVRRTCSSALVHDNNGHGGGGFSREATVAHVRLGPAYHGGGSSPGTVWGASGGASVGGCRDAPVISHLVDVVRRAHNSNSHNDDDDNPSSSSSSGGGGGSGGNGGGGEGEGEGGAQRPCILIHSSSERCAAADVTTVLRSLITASWRLNNSTARGMQQSSSSSPLLQEGGRGGWREADRQFCALVNAKVKDN
jgi:hypothetical protein